MPEFQPLRDARVGEWAAYTTQDGRTLRYEVVEIGPTTVTSQVTVHEHGRPIGQPARRRDHETYDPLARQAKRAESTSRKVSSAAIDAAGRTWEALLYEDRWVDENIAYVRRTWVSAAVPVFGMIRMELHGDDALEARLQLNDLSDGPSHMSR